MAGMGDLFKELLDRQAEAMKQYQDSLASSMKAWQDAVSPNAGATAEAGERVSFVPDAAKLAESYFAFAGEMLDRQHEFAMKLIETIQPATS